MQKLMLDDGLLQKVHDNKKIGTSRTGRRDVELGPLKLEAVNNTVDDIVVEVKSVTYMKLIDVPIEVIKLEGYSSLSELLNSLKRFYPNIDIMDELTFIEWYKK